MVWRLGPLLIVGVVLWAPALGAQGVGFLTEQERLASYCAGVFEARMRDMSEFLKNQCAGSTRRECRAMAEDSRRRRCTIAACGTIARQIIASREQGKREKALSTNTIAKGHNDWLTSKQRDPRQAGRGAAGLSRQPGLPDRHALRFPRSVGSPWRDPGARLSRAAHAHVDRALPGARGLSALEARVPHMIMSDSGSRAPSFIDTIKVISSRFDSQGVDEV